MILIYSPLSTQRRKYSTAVRQDLRNYIFLPTKLYILCPQGLFDLIFPLIKSGQNKQPLRSLRLERSGR